MPTIEKAGRATEAGQGQKTGSLVGAAVSVYVNLGFAPMWVQVVNETDGIIWEKTSGMAAANCVKTTNVPTLAIDTTSAITFNQFGFTLAAALAATGKAISYIALHTQER
jgi:hypothetical protein